MGQNSFADYGKLKHLFDLEKELLEPETRKNLPRLEILLHKSFFEFGSSGKRISRESMLKFLPTEGLVLYSATNFSAVEICNDAVLVTYEAERKIGKKITTKSLRSSIWKQTEKGWQMFFHQGTIQLGEK